MAMQLVECVVRAPALEPNNAPVMDGCSGGGVSRLPASCLNIATQIIAPLLHCPRYCAALLGSSQRMEAPNDQEGMRFHPLSGKYERC